MPTTPRKSASEMHPIPESVRKKWEAEKAAAAASAEAKPAPKETLQKTKILNKPRKGSKCLKVVRRLYPPMSAIFVCSMCLMYRFLPKDHELNYATNMMRLSYEKTKQDGTVLYGKGIKDVPVVVFLVFCMFCCRYLITEYIFSPLSRLLGTQKKKKGSFLDMGWQFVWYTASWLASAYFVSTETQFEFDNMWKGQNNLNIEDT
jgi:hypothetical protein